MELAQDAPPNPQHRVGTIGGRPSHQHDAPSTRVPCQQDPCRCTRKTTGPSHRAAKALTPTGE